MILDENLFTPLNEVGKGVVAGTKRGPYNKDNEESRYETITNLLYKTFVKFTKRDGTKGVKRLTAYPDTQIENGFYFESNNPELLQKGKDILDKFNIDYKQVGNKVSWQFDESDFDEIDTSKLSYKAKELFSEEDKKLNEDIIESNDIKDILKNNQYIYNDEYEAAKIRQQFIESPFKTDPQDLSKDTLAHWYISEVSYIPGLGVPGRVDADSMSSVGYLSLPITAREQKIVDTIKKVAESAGLIFRRNPKYNDKDKDKFFYIDSPNNRLNKLAHITTLNDNIKRDIKQEIVKILNLNTSYPFHTYNEKIGKFIETLAKEKNYDIKVHYHANNPDIIWLEINPNNKESLKNESFNDIPGARERTIEELLELISNYSKEVKYFTKKNDFKEAQWYKDQIDWAIDQLSKKYDNMFKHKEESLKEDIVEYKIMRLGSNHTIHDDYPKWSVQIRDKDKVEKVFDILDKIDDEEENKPIVILPNGNTIEFATSSFYDKDDIEERVKKALIESLEENIYATQSVDGNEMSFDVQDDGTLIIYKGSEEIRRTKTDPKYARKVFSDLGFKEMVKEDWKDIAKSEDDLPRDLNQDIIIATFKDGEDIHRIVKAQNGKFFNEYSLNPTNTYNVFVPSSYAGPFDSKEEAQRMLLKHRPKAVKNSNESLKEDTKEDFKYQVTYTNSKINKYVYDLTMGMTDEHVVSEKELENKLLKELNFNADNDFIDIDIIESKLTVCSDKNQTTKEEIDKAFNKIMSEYLNESLKEDLSQEEQQEYGLNTLVNQLIKSEYDAIDEYNSAIVTFEAENQGEYTDVIRSIIEDERHHIGNLQEIMNRITPGTSAEFEHGKEEAIETLDEEKPEETRTTIDTENGEIKTYKLDKVEKEN